jgi:hypothetical protein
MRTPAPGSFVRVTTDFPNNYLLRLSGEDRIVQTFEGRVLPRVSVDHPDEFRLEQTQGPRAVGAPSELIRIFRVNTPYLTHLEVLGQREETPIKNEPAPYGWLVQSPSGGRYVVRKPKSGWTCTCPGFQFHRSCKHLHWVQEFLQQQPSVPPTPVK